VKEASILTTPNTPNTDFFNKQQNNPPSLPSVKGSTYPDPNLGCWQENYLKYSCGVGSPESYEHFVALNNRFPNLTPLELEDICNKIKSGDNSIFKDY
jgi:hypothetical protein